MINALIGLVTLRNYLQYLSNLFDLKYLQAVSINYKLLCYSSPLSSEDNRMS